MSSHIEKIVCITENFSDGQKIIAADIIYNKDIDGSWISASSFWVKGRRIKSVEVNGKSVKLCLNRYDEMAALVASPGPARSMETPPEFSKTLPKGGPRDMRPAERRPVQVVVKQVGQIRTTDGSIIEPWTEEVTSTESIQPVVSEFKQFEFEGIPYNLFIPASYDRSKPLPLVVFIHDAGPCGPDPLITLSQGSGAISFADREWQNGHPCLVLAPQINRGIRLTSDEFHGSDTLETIKRMIDDVAEKYNADKTRIYATGQSMGCMSFCELNIRYPEYFAASLLVAGQWSPEKMAEKCCKCKMWILVSEHDARAFPGMNAVTDAMEKAGASIGRYYWDAKMTVAQANEKIRDAMNDGNAIKYTVFKGSSVVPPQRMDSPGDNHTSTWNVVYPMNALKEWLFSNSLE